ncbi:DUF3077 domain-containing protein [Pseudomonas sp. QC2]|uniref:DUF3077 domain-containing protein n=1 Tax=Pseudomonas sp. QC2 TaxID=2065822 RepID=UPI000C7DC4E2|nr:DUF3077 domain-containing protein [Pseudomonas sp. QC2]PLR64605.1 DUF3077 domain-containing protein [Pseudomonas sp. QC2]
MVKATSTDPQANFPSEDALLNRRAIDYYLKACAPDAPHFALNDNLSFEDALAHAADLLHCAVEMAKGVVDRALECVQPR